MINPDYYLKNQNDENYKNNKKTVDFLRNEINCKNLNNKSYKILNNCLKEININNIFEVKKEEIIDFNNVFFIYEMLNKKFGDSLLEIVSDKEIFHISYNERYTSYYSKSNASDNLEYNNEATMENNSFSLILNLDTCDNSNAYFI